MKFSNIILRVIVNFQPLIEVPETDTVFNVQYDYFCLVSMCIFCIAVGGNYQAECLRA